MLHAVLGVVAAHVAACVAGDAIRSMCGPRRTPQHERPASGSQPSHFAFRLPSLSRGGRDKLFLLVCRYAYNHMFPKNGK